jgi:hypothetical protein
MNIKFQAHQELANVFFSKKLSIFLENLKFLVFFGVNLKFFANVLEKLIKFSISQIWKNNIQIMIQ